MNKETDLICICCPNGCHLHVDKDLNVTGNRCPRGAAYGKTEVSNPTRILTSCVKLISKEFLVLPVKSSGPIPKGKIFQAMDEINKVVVKAPVHIGDVVLKDLVGSGVDLVATREVLE